MAEQILKHKTTLRLRIETIQALAVIAARQRRTVAQVLRQLVEEFVLRETKKTGSHSAESMAATEETQM